MAISTTPVDEFGEPYSPAAPIITDVGAALVSLPNPGAVRFIRINANNTVSAVDFTSIQEAWSVPVLQNSWVNFGGAYAPPAYRKDLQGYVRLRGLIKSGTATDGTLLFTLPAGYRPPADVIIVTVANNGSANSVAAINIAAASGNVVISGTAQNAWLSLNGISFSTT